MALFPLRGPTGGQLPASLRSLLHGARTPGRGPRVVTTPRAWSGADGDESTSRGKTGSVFARRRSVGLGLVATGVVCPCHVLVGLVGLLTGGALMSPAAQDGLHAVYVPCAVLAGAALLRRR